MLDENMFELVQVFGDCICEMKTMQSQDSRASKPEIIVAVHVL